MKFLLLNWLLALMPPTRWFGPKRRLLILLGVAVGEGSRVCGQVRFYGAGRVTIGAQCWIGIGTRFYTSAGGGDIIVEDGCDIAPDVCFHTGSHAIGGRDRRAGANTTGPVRIGAGTWIGVRTTILADTVIAPGSVVGAGALVVSGHYPADGLLIGIPARPVRTLPV